MPLALARKMYGIDRFALGRARDSQIVCGYIAVSALTLSRSGGEANLTIFL